MGFIKISKKTTTIIVFIVSICLILFIVCMLMNPKSIFGKEGAMNMGNIIITRAPTTRAPASAPASTTRARALALALTPASTTRAPTTATTTRAPASTTTRAPTTAPTTAPAPAFTCAPDPVPMPKPDYSSFSSCNSSKLCSTVNMKATNVKNDRCVDKNLSSPCARNYLLTNEYTSSNLGYKMTYNSGKPSVCYPIKAGEGFYK
jgi:hypothetical protein